MAQQNSPGLQAWEIVPQNSPCKGDQISFAKLGIGRSSMNEHVSDKTHAFRPPLQGGSENERTQA